MGKYKKYFVLCAILVSNSSVGATYYFGNLSTYMISGLRSKSRGNSFDIDSSWMFPAYVITKVFGTFMADLCIRKLGLKPANGIGIISNVLGTFLTYFSATHSIWASTLTFPFLVGLGNSIILMANLIYVAKWFKTKVGLATSLAFGATALGGVVINQIVTQYINPRNLSPNIIDGDFSFFSQAEIVERVPMAFVVIGGFTGGVQLTGFLLTREPQTNDVLEEESTLLELSEDKDSFNKVEVTYYTYGENSPANNISPSMSTSRNSVDLTGRYAEGQVHQNHGTCNTRHQVSSQVGIDSKQEESFFTPGQVLKTMDVYVLEGVALAQALNYLIVANYYKTFGQRWIDDDKFLAFIGSSMSFCVIPFVTVCGYLTDKFGMKESLIGHLALMTVLQSFWYFSPMPSPWLYLVSIVMLYSVGLNESLLIPLATLRYFGKPYYAANFALVQIGTLVGYLLGPLLIAYLLANFGWFWVFFVNGCIAFCALIPVLWKLSS